MKKNFVSMINSKKKILQNPFQTTRVEGWEIPTSEKKIHKTTSNFD